MSQKTVADIILDTIQAAGVKRIYGLAGEALYGLGATIQARENLELVQVRQEEGGAFAAGGEAHITASLAVCIGSCGPGNAQLVNGLFDCHRSHVPVLVIAAQVPSAEIGSDYFQETHPERLFRECSHYCEVIAVPEQAVRITEAAIQAALSLGGVGVVVVPSDVAQQQIEAPAPRIPALGHHSAIVPANDKVLQAAQLLNDCERVTILAGSGTEGAHAELLQVAQALQAPVVHALRGKECVEASNPFDVGMTGLLGMPAGYHALMSADAVLMLGTDFPYRQYFPENARVVQVDKRPEHIGRRARVEVGLHGTVADTLHQLLPHLHARANDAHLLAAQRQHAADRQQLAELAVGQPGAAALRPQHLAQLLSEMSADDAVFTCDVGTPLIWASRYLRMNGRRRLINSFVHGSMGAALPQAIGIAQAAPGRQVVALCGDGSFTMLLSELLTLRQLQASIKIIIFNNGGYEYTALEMKATGTPATNTQLDTPNFAQLAEAAGIRGWRVSDPGQLEGVLREVLAHEGPVVVDALIGREALSLPPPLAEGRNKGLSLYEQRVLVNGRGSELLEMA